MRWKLLYIIHLAHYPNRNSPTDSAEKAILLCGVAYRQSSSA
jgi:hypothetical protein